VKVPLLACVLFLLSVPITAQQLVTSLTDPHIVLQTGHGGWVDAIAVSPALPWSSWRLKPQSPGFLIATGGHEGNVLVWDSSSGEKLRSFFVSSDGIAGVQFFNHTPELIMVGADGAVVIANVNTGQIRTVLRLPKDAKCVVLSPDQRSVAVGYAKSIILLDIASLKQISFAVSGALLNFSQDGTRLVAGGRATMSADEPFKVVVIKVVGSHQVYDLSLSDRDTVALSFADKDHVLDWSVPTLKSRLQHFALFRDGCFSEPECNKVLVWSISAKPTIVQTFLGPTQFPSVARIGASGDTFYQVSATSSQVAVWGKDGATHPTVSIAPYVPTVLCVSPDAHSILYDSDKGITVSSLTGLQPSLKIGSVVSSVHGIWFSPDNRQLYVEAQYGVEHWDLYKNTSPKRLFQFPVSFSDDGRSQIIFRWAQALGYRDESGQIIDLNYPSIGTTAQLSHDGKLLAVATGNDVFVMPPGTTSSNLQPFKNLSRYGVRTLGFSNDAKYLTVITNDAKIYRFSVTQTSAVGYPKSVSLRTSDTFLPWAISISPDGSKVAIGGNREFAEIRDSDSFQIIARLHGVQDANAIAISPDGKTAACVTWSGIISIFDLATGHLRARYRAHNGNATAVRFSRDGRFIVSGGDDGLAQVWDAHTFHLVYSMATLEEDNSGNADNAWVSATPEGLFDGSAPGMQSIGWRLDNTNIVRPLANYYSSFFSPGLTRAVFTGHKPMPIVDLDMAFRFPGLDVLAQGHGFSVLTYKGKRVFCVKDNPDVKVDSSIKGTSGPISGCLWSADVPTGLHLSQPSISVNTVLTEPPAIPKAKIHVLTVGITNYNGLSLLNTGNYSNLPTASGDADQIADWFVAHVASAQLQNYQKLRDETASLSNIIFQLQVMAAVSKPDDIAFIFIEGHGAVVQGEEMYYFIPSVKPANGGFDVPKESDVALTSAMLGDALMSIPAKYIFLVMDSCHSGATLTSLRKVAEAKFSGRGSDPASGGIVLVSSTTPLDAALQFSRLDHSVLTSVLLDTLTASVSGSTALSGGMLRDAIQRKTAPLAATRGYVQVPEVVQLGSDFLFPIIGNPAPTTPP